MIKVGDKTYRNLQEQVGKNQEDIDEIKKAMPIPYNEYYTKEQVEALIPKPHQVTFMINNFSQVANYMHPSPEALTDEEFKNFLKKIKILKVIGNQDGGIGESISCDIPSENLISYRSTWAAGSTTLTDDIQEFEPDEITFTDRVIEY